MQLQYSVIDLMGLGWGGALGLDWRCGEVFRKASSWGNEREPGMLWEVEGWSERVRKEAGAVEKVRDELTR